MFIIIYVITRSADFGLQLLYYGMYKSFSVHTFYSTECVGFFMLCNSFKTFLINKTTIVITLNVTHIGTSVMFYIRIALHIDNNSDSNGTPWIDTMLHFILFRTSA